MPRLPEDHDELDELAEHIAVHCMEIVAVRHDHPQYLDALSATMSCLDLRPREVAMLVMAFIGGYDLSTESAGPELTLSMN